VLGSVPSRGSGPAIHSRRTSSDATGAPIAGARVIRWHLARPGVGLADRAVRPWDRRPADALAGASSTRIFGEIPPVRAVHPSE